MIEIFVFHYWLKEIKGGEKDIESGSEKGVNMGGGGYPHICYTYSPLWTIIGNMYYGVAPLGLVGHNIMAGYMLFVITVYVCKILVLKMY